nr:immunoglobulin heavy chain junction region [Mus musculus]
CAKTGGDGNEFAYW